MTSPSPPRPLLDDTPAAADAQPGVLTARRHVPPDEPFFAGHFPGHPVTPGVFALEALVECVRQHLGPDAPWCGAPLVRFRRQIAPGDTLELAVTPSGSEDGRLRFTAVASVAGQRAVEATLDFRAPPDGGGNP